MLIFVRKHLQFPNELPINIISSTHAFPNDVANKFDLYWLGCQFGKGKSLVCHYHQEISHAH